MSDKNLPRIPVNRRANIVREPPQPQEPTRARSGQPNEVRILQKWKSLPELRGGPGGDGNRSENSVAMEKEGGGFLYWPGTCMEAFAPPEILLPRSPQKRSDGYNKDAKVVVNVTVESSPGPIRTMLKLGSSVEDIIRAVVKKYNEEARSPCLDAASTFELHPSYFSVQSLSKSDAIGDVGSRSFYLRTCSSKSEDKNISNSLSNNDILPRDSTDRSAVTYLHSILGLMEMKIKNIIERTIKVWKIMCCMQ